MRIDRLLAVAVATLALSASAEWKQVGSLQVAGADTIDAAVTRLGKMCGNDFAASGIKSAIDEMPSVKSARALRQGTSRSYALYFDGTGFGTAGNGVETTLPMDGDVMRLRLSPEGVKAMSEAFGKAKGVDADTVKTLRETGSLSAGIRVNDLGLDVRGFLVPQAGTALAQLERKTLAAEPLARGLVMFMVADMPETHRALVSPMLIGTAKAALSGTAAAAWREKEQVRFRCRVPPADVKGIGNVIGTYLRLMPHAN